MTKRDPLSDAARMTDLGRQGFMRAYRAPKRVRAYLFQFTNTAGDSRYKSISAKTEKIATELANAEKRFGERVTFLYEQR